jgi:Flp pilus assembly protein TadD
LHIARKETDKAMALYGRLEAADPWGGTMERTRAWMALGNVDKAEESARHLIRLSPDKAQSYMPLAAILEARKDRAAAEKELLKAVALEPKNARVGVILGEFQLRGRDLDKALKTFDSVLAYAPTDAQALTGKGMVVQLNGDRDGAAKLYLQAVQAKHDHVSALNNLAMLWADNEKTRLQAVNLAVAAFVRSNANPLVIDTLGYVLIRNERAEEALKILDRALTLAPGNPAIMFHRALAQEALGRRSEALGTLKQALAGGEFQERTEAERLLKKLDAG